MRKQAERWGAELHQEDVEFVNVKSSPFVIRSSDREVQTSVLFVSYLVYILEFELALPQGHVVCVLCCLVIKTMFKRRENDVFTRKRSCEIDV